MNLRGKRIVGTIVSIERLPSSQYGNPRYRMTFAAHGGTVAANTASDHAFNYEIGNVGCREGSQVRFTIGGRGTIVDIETGVE